MSSIKQINEYMDAISTKLMENILKNPDKICNKSQKQMIMINVCIFHKLVNMICF